MESFIIIIIIIIIIITNIGTVRLPEKPQSGEVWCFLTSIKINTFGGLRKICELASAGLNTGVDFSSVQV